MRPSLVRWLVRSCVLVCVMAAVATPLLAQKRGDRALLTRQDIEEGGGGLTTAHDAIQRLRPNWMRPQIGRTASSGMLDGFGDRSNSTPREPIVYINDVRQPNLEILRTVQSIKVVEMKFLDQNRAVQQLGPGHEAGAIMVTTADKK
jgi:hypothetical protein